MKHTKNLLKCLFAAFCTATLAFNASAFTPETVEKAAEPTEAVQETAALSAVVSTKPGLNILTGTTEPFGFEVENIDALSDLFTYSYVDNKTNETVVTWELTDDPVDGSKGKTLRQAKAWQALTSVNFAGNTYEKERPFEWAVDALGANKVSGANPCLILYANAAADRAAIKVRPSFDVGSWQRLTGEVVISRDTADYKDDYNPKPSDWVFNGNFKGLAIGLSASSERGTYPSSYCYLYIDNYSIMPYYRVTYYGADGNVDSSAYFLRDSEGTVMTSFTPDYAPIFNIEGGKYRRCLGWSTEPNATEAQTSFALNNEDLVLYPVLGEEFEPLSLSSSVLRAGGANKETGTLTVIDGFTVTDWKVDTGYSDALVTVSEDKRTVTVEPTGYAGVVTVTATMGGELAGTELEKVIRLYGGTEYKPGLNLITGTPIAFDFENITQADLNRAFAATDWLGELDKNGAEITDGWTHTTDPLRTGYAVRQSSTWRELITTSLGDNQTGDSDRPFYCSFDTLATGNPDFFVIPYDWTYTAHEWVYPQFKKWHRINKTVTMSQVKLKADTGAWVNKSRFRNIGIGLGNANQEYSADATAYFYVDNFSIIPGYKITYIAADGTETVVYVDGLKTEYTPDLTVLGSDSYTVEGSNEVYTTATAIPLEYKDIVIKAFTPEEPKTSDKNSIRVSGEKTGIRFGGFVGAGTHNAASEYGFLVARGDNSYWMVADEDLMIKNITTDNEYSFTGTTEAGEKFVGGRNYIKGGDSNKFVFTDGGETPFGSYGSAGYYFTAVMVGLDSPYTVTEDGVKTTYQTRYRVPIVARSYVKVGENYYYGECQTASMKDVAAHLLNNPAASEKDKALAQEILAKAELTVESID